MLRPGEGGRGGESSDMGSEEKSKRLRERVRLELPVRVQCREAAEREWVELTRLLDVTPFGAAFTLARPTEPGRLLHLTLPLPRQLRCFDHVEQQYRVWALVRRVRPHAAQAGGAPRYEVGVAFVGKNPPATYAADPSKRYEIRSLTGDGQWSLDEQKEGGAPTGSRSDQTRLNMPVAVVLEELDEKGEVAAREETITENISRRGAAVLTARDTVRGRFVRLTSQQFQLSVLAAVRARRVGPDGVARLHLEFIDRQWPLEGVE